MQKEILIYPSCSTSTSGSALITPFSGYRCVQACLSWFIMFICRTHTIDLKNKYCYLFSIIDILVSWSTSQTKLHTALMCEDKRLDCVIREYSFSRPEEVTNWTCLRRHLFISWLTRPSRETNNSRASVLGSVIPCVGVANRGVKLGFRLHSKDSKGDEMDVWASSSSSEHAQNSKPTTLQHTVSPQFWAVKESFKSTVAHLDLNWPICCVKLSTILFSSIFCDCIMTWFLYFPSIGRDRHICIIISNNNNTNIIITIKDICSRIKASLSWERAAFLEGCCVYSAA